MFAYGDATYQGSIRATVSGAANLGAGYALIVDRGVVTLPVAGYVSATGSGRLVGAISSAGELWFVHDTGDVRNADGTASLVSPPAVAVARVNRSVDC